MLCVRAEDALAAAAAVAAASDKMRASSVTMSVPASVPLSLLFDSCQFWAFCSSKLAACSFRLDPQGDAADGRRWRPETGRRRVPAAAPGASDGGERRSVGVSVGELLRGWFSSFLLHQSTLLCPFSVP
jgi:hypothetical protein